MSHFCPASYLGATQYSQVQGALTGRFGGLEAGHQCLLAALGITIGGGKMGLPVARNSLVRSGIFFAQ